MIDPHQLHRSTDPHTSRLAAAEVLEDGTVGRMCAKALELLGQYPGRTAAELEQLSGLTDGKIRKRLNDLRHHQPPLASTGTSRVCAVTGKLAQTWFLATQDANSRHQVQQVAGGGCKTESTDTAPPGRLFDDSMPRTDPRVDGSRL